jgi:CDP-diacylglycerol--glycerol-3-phosphate 3-phosphatidyltransferase
MLLKVNACSHYLALVKLEEVPTWGVFVILARELVIAGWWVNQTKITGANIWGKLKTVSQIMAIARVRRSQCAGKP